MDNFKAVYNILSALEKAMDLPEFDLETISHEVLGISYQRWARYLEMMADVGYIKGIRINQNINGEMQIHNIDVKITLKGLEYLQENSIMQKIFKTMKGIKEITPCI